MAISTRNVFRARATGGEMKLPATVSEAKWLPVGQAIEQITIPHIKFMVDIISKNPNQVSGGTLSQFKKDGVWQSEVLERFYPMTRKSQ